MVISLTRFFSFKRLLTQSLKLNTIHHYKKMSSNKNIVAICHMRATNNKEFNRIQVLEIVRKSKEKNASVSFVYIIDIYNN